MPTLTIKEIIRINTPTNAGVSLRFMKVKSKTKRLKTPFATGHQAKTKKSRCTDITNASPPQRIVRSSWRSEKVTGNEAEKHYDMRTLHIFSQMITQ